MLRLVILINLIFFFVVIPLNLYINKRDEDKENED